jgi:phospholipid/cholesterol/gamma-HCH transport system substrate-binding protein
VVAGVILGVGAVIWLGASKYFQKGSMYATYFDESVQGLQTDSSVKYRGVDVGTVKSIGVAPDKRLIEVVMKIDVAGFSVSGVTARLSLAGITGFVYVELDRKMPEDHGFVPKDFTPQYPVIPSSPSGIKRIEAGVTDIVRSIKEIDFKGISDQLLQTAKSIDGFVTGDRLNRIMENLLAGSASLASASDKINDLIADGSFKEAAHGAKEAVAETRGLIAQVRGEIEAMKIGRTADNVNKMVVGTSAKVQSILTEVEEMTEQLKRAADSIEMLMDRLNADPSALIFSRPPEGE